MTKQQTIYLGDSVKLIGSDHPTPVFTLRTAEAILQEIRAAHKANPAAPVRMDIHERESGALEAVIATLEKEGWGWAYSKHADRLRDSTGFGRFLFFKPPVSLPSRKNKAAWTRAFYTEGEITAGFSSACYDYGVLMPKLTAAERQRDDAFRAMERKRDEFSRNLAHAKERHEKETLSQAQTAALLRGVIQGFRLPLALLEQAVTGKTTSVVHKLDERDFLIVMAMFARKQKTNKTRFSRDTLAPPEDNKTFTFAAEMTDTDIAQVAGLSRQSVIMRRRVLFADPDIAALLKSASERYGPDSSAFIPRQARPGAVRVAPAVIRESGEAARDDWQKYHPLDDESDSKKAGGRSS